MVYSHSKGVNVMGILVKQQSYRVQEVSHFDKDKAYLVGKKVLLLDIEGGQASVQYRGSKAWIPNRALIVHNGFVMKAVQIKNADAVAICVKNPLIPVGVVFTEFSQKKDKTIVVTYNGVVRNIPENYICCMVAEKVDEIVISARRVSKRTGIPTPVIEACQEVVAPASNRKDIEELPDILLRLFPNLDLVALREKLMNGEDVIFDYSGEMHTTLVDADKANTKIRHKLVTNALIDLAGEFFQETAENIRNKH